MGVGLLVPGGSSFPGSGSFGLSSCACRIKQLHNLHVNRALPCLLYQLERV